ncbi:MAG TPA: hypothetical protein VJX66_20970 [Amycolatopsis sp.]|nr:hypothetical protein [Amycolatopsis sp.]
MTGWVGAVTRLEGNVDVAGDAWAALTWQYGESHRRYHTLRHAEAVVRDSRDLGGTLGFHDQAVVELAAWAHDVVYNANPGEDERESAAWARRWLGRSGVAGEYIDRVEGLILTTIKHDAPAADHLATALLDADLAILGADPRTYDTYALAVRQEYAKYSDEVWRAGRIAVLEGMLSRTIYRGATARARWERAARRNITAELTRQRGRPGGHG